MPRGVRNKKTEEEARSEVDTVHKSAERRQRHVDPNDGTTDIIGRALGLDIAPRLSIEQTLDAIDDALRRIDAIMAELGDRQGTGGATATAPERTAFRRFMASLVAPLARQGKRLRVTETGTHVKIESLVNGHRLYVSKGKVRVGRVDSTLPPALIPGAVRPTHHNGRIVSWIPTTPEHVTAAIELLGTEGIPSL